MYRLLPARGIAGIVALVIMLMTSAALPAQNNALHLDGVNDYVTVPNSASLNPTNGITLEAWFRVHSNWQGAGNDPLLRKAFSSHVPPYYQYGLALTGSTYPTANQRAIAFELTMSNNSSFALSVAPGFQVGTWHHMAGTWDGDTMRLFLDGVELRKRPLQGTLAAYNTPVQIGKFTNLSFWLPIEVDEVRIWNFGRCGNEIQATMNCELTGGESGLAMYYNFNQGTPGGNNGGLNTVPDLSGNNNNGSLVGFGLNGNTSNFIASNANLNGGTCATTGNCNPSASSVPTLSEWGLMVMILLMLCAGAVALRQRKSSRDTALAKKV